MLAICISVAIVFLGLLALRSLSVEKFPDIAPPTVRVTASYMGASAEAVQNAVIIPLEESINGVENMSYMESDASAGSATINIVFKMGTDPNQAAINVQNKVSEAQGQLPSEVIAEGITVRKRQISTLAIIGFYSPDDSFDEIFISNYININIIPQVQRIEGVGDIFRMGSNYSIRIWLNPEDMAHYGLVPSDITAVLDAQNIEASTGSFGENSATVFTYTMKYRGRYQTPEEFGELVVRSTSGGEVLRMKDIARIELGNESYSYVGGTNGHPGVIMMINQIAGSNATQINTDIANLLETLKVSFPAGFDYVYLQNTNDFLFASIWEVVRTLFEAICLVVLVVFFFLHDYKLTLIPTISLLVSLIGTFAFIYLLGFSLNLLTLFALILVIGTVVDDAIVVVEAVQTRMDEGETNAAAATAVAMHNITAAIVTSTIVFMAVFIPVSFMSGTSGIFYKQFGLTMAVAVGISAINALSLSPALCALLLQRQSPDLPFASFVKKVYTISYEALVRKYNSALKLFLNKKWITVVILVGLFLPMILLMRYTKTGLIPNEDTGTLFVSVNTAPGSNTMFTASVIDRIEAIVRHYPEIKAYSKVVGNSMTGGAATSSGMLVIQLENWSKRKGSAHSSTAIMNRLNRDMTAITDAEVFVMAPSMIDGYGRGNAVELHLQDQQGGDIRDFFDISQQFMGSLNQRPEVMMAFSSFKVDYPQYVVDVDAAKCMRAGVSPSEILDVISGYYGGIYASNIIRFSKVYRVIIQASPDYRLDARSLDNIYFRNGDIMAPVSQYVTLSKTYAPEILSRFNLFNAITSNITINTGYSSGNVISAIREVAAETLPGGYSYEFGSSSREQSETDNTVFILIICVIFIYLLLCSLYESLFVPFAVILSVPSGILGCFVAAQIFDVENNIYLQTGMIMIIGLLSKTAILITEYASVRRAAGMSIWDAAYDAARVRLRPILMTVLTIVFGMFPLLFASGAGANGNRALGAGVVGGMVIGTVVLLLVVPPLFIIFQKLQEKYGFIIRHAGLLILTATLAGCGTYASYRTPVHTEIDTAYGMTIDTDSTSLGDLHWRLFFNDPQLHSLIDTALLNNADLQIALFNIEIAQASLKASRLAFFPAFDFSPSISYDGSSTVQLPVNAGWQVDIFGRLRNAKRRNQAALRQTEAYAKAVRSQLIATVAATYYTLLHLDAQFDIYEETEKSWRQNIETTRFLMNAGRFNSASLSQTEAGYCDVLNNLIDIRRQIQATENILCSLLGQTPHTIPRGTAGQWQPPAIISLGLPAHVLACRPDVKQAEMELAQAFYATAESRAALYPTITISGSYDFREAIYNIIGTVFQPLFQRGTLRANLRIAKAGQQQAAIAFRQTIIDAGIEVNDALMAVKSSQAKQENYDQQVKHLDNAVNSTRLLMAHGSTTYLEVLTAQQTLLSAQINRVLNSLARVSNMITLYQALGGGKDFVPLE